MNAPDFSSEYDLGSRRALCPRGRGFELVVTPRYEQHYLRKQSDGLRNRPQVVERGRPVKWRAG